MYVELFSELEFNQKEFEVTALVHPRGEVNILLFGSRQGQLQLWNINTMKLLCSYVGWGAPVTVLEQVHQIIHFMFCGNSKACCILTTLVSIL